MPVSGQTTFPVPPEIFAAIGFYGNGESGNLTVTGTTTLTAGVSNYANITIRSTGILKPAGAKISVSGTLTIEAGGSINDNGNNASGATGGTSLGDRLAIRGNGYGGGAGASTAANGTNGTGFSGSNHTASQITANTHRGGDGGASGGGQTGGVRGTVQSNSNCSLYLSHFAWLAVGFSPVSGTIYYAGASGGGGGASDGTGVGGGGGGGGGAVWLAARQIYNSGTISANGGTGANATGTNAGGGGGGGGGWVTIFYRDGSTGTVQTNGGSGGTKVGTGSNGSPGNAGASFIYRM